MNLILNILDYFFKFWSGFRSGCIVHCIFVSKVRKSFLFHLYFLPHSSNSNIIHSLVIIYNIWLHYHSLRLLMIRCINSIPNILIFLIQKWILIILNIKLCSLTLICTWIILFINLFEIYTTARYMQILSRFYIYEINIVYIWWFNFRQKSMRDLILHILKLLILNIIELTFIVILIAFINI